MGRWKIRNLGVRRGTEWKVLQCLQCMPSQLSHFAMNLPRCPRFTIVVGTASTTSEFLALFTLWNAKEDAPLRV
ncbi:hypothetical protein CPB83DRAFT_852766 [Crepidotus variabilis]|uniref:Uncharacterized protein n=1 Tax=Crepidotus variabilis TaxID=179855 RepID=A0A9P6EH31_9AGAR|nr:hypothetical protein CPB83DRAFT_852766 [Crepidotus variabilis]